MTKPFYTLLLIVFCGCSNFKRVEIKGVSKNAKAGAIIEDESGSIYYLNNKNTWTKDQVNKIIIVKGKIKIYNEESKNDTTKVISQSVLSMKIIKYYNIKFIE